MAALFSSRRFSIVLVFLAAVLLAAVFGAPEAVLGPLAAGVGAALPVVVGGESWADRYRAADGPSDRRRRPEVPPARPPPEGA
jgi:hypothetical protein